MRAGTTEWTAEREFEATGARKVIARIGRPTHTATGEWSAAVEISGVGKIEAGEAFGEDSMQALLLAASMLRAQLASIQQEHQLTWLTDVDLGIHLEPR